MLFVQIEVCSTNFAAQMQHKFCRPKIWRKVCNSKRSDKISRIECLAENVLHRGSAQNIQHAEMHKIN